jgi:acetylornithine/succinyldiaminopimelate/putrescine aminotransferase
MPMDVQQLRAREAAHFIPVVNRLPVAMVEGRGSRLRDESGREYVDLMSGWGVTCLGHCHPALVEAIRDQAGRLMQTTNVFYTLPQLELIERLAAVLPRALSHSFIVSTGTEAVEGVVKTAHRATGRTRFVSTHGSFHGRTLGALRVIGQDKHHAPYRALLPERSLVPFGDIDAARAAILDERDGPPAAFILEPIQGEGGVNVSPPGYLAALRDLCDAAGALLIFDEVQTGIGRTGTWVACQHEGVTPDLLTLGKGLGGGFPVGAFVMTQAVASRLALGDHGSTYGGNPLACAAANAVLRTIADEKLCERAAETGERVMQRLHAFASEHADLVEAPRGRGLLIGLPVRNEKRAATIALRALERGVVVNVTAGRVVRLFPALNIPDDDLWPALDIVLDLVTHD